MRQLAATETTARPHFICRDINSGSIKDIVQQFEKIKAGLEEAAKAADTDLASLVSMEVTADEMMNTFHGAIDRKTIGTNSYYVQTRYNEKFRNQCSELRLKLHKFARNLADNQRMATLELLVEHMNVVWDALTQSDDLVMIKDLRHINDMKNLMTAIEEFKKIMAKAKGIEVNHVEPNPLMRATGTPDQEL